MSPTELAAASVLVVDDEPVNIALVRGLLERAGAREIRTTLDPRHAVQLFRQSRPDLVLLDLHMPGMDGIALMEALRREVDDADFVPMVVLTADSTQPTRERVLQAGANDFLAKPFDLRELVLRAGNLLATRAMHARVATELRERRRTDAAADAARRERREAVEAVLDAGGPRMVFQPIVDLGSGAVLKYEALARFDTQPSRPPDAWFADAAAVGLGAALELAAVAAALSALPRLPRGVRLGLNVSPATAMSSQLAALVAADADRIVLEITEHVRVDDYDVLTGALDGLRACGMRVSVDDAGAGYAGLTHILRLDPDYIKLDIGLTRGVDASPVKRALASALASFAAELGAVIIAEGVETAAEAEVLASLGITAGQGFHLGRPGPLPAVLDAARYA